MNWDHLRYFLLVSEQGSVSRAAQVAGVSHATVLRAIAKLEQVLQLRLFDHARTGYRLTPDGEEIFENAREMGDEVQIILQKAKRRDSQLHGELSIVLPDSGIIDLLPKIASFLSTHAEVNVNTIEANPDSLDNFVKSKVDVAFLVTNNPPEQLVGRKLANVSFVLAGAKTVAKDSTEAIDQIGDWISWGSKLHTEEFIQLQEDTRRHHGANKSTIHTAGHDSALGAIRQRLGVAVISRGALGDSLEEVNPSRKPAEFGLWMLTHPDYRGIPRVSAFMRFMTEVFTDVV